MNGKTGWIAIRPYIITVGDDWITEYESDLRAHGSRSDAISHGFSEFGHDDFLVGRVKDGRLQLLAWMAEDRDDPDEVRQAATKLALVGDPA